MDEISVSGMSRLGRRWIPSILGQVSSMCTDSSRLVFKENGLDYPMGASSYQCWVGLSSLVGGGATRTYSDIATGTHDIDHFHHI